MAKITAYHYHDTLEKIGVAAASGLITAIALNFFLTPAKVFQSGATGIAQLLSLFLQGQGIAHTDLTGWFNLLLNIPLAILGWKTLGKSFTAFSFLNSVLISALAIILPVHALSGNPLMNAIFGGVLTGAGVGIALRYGFSTGGMDILSMYLSKHTRRTVGVLMFVINFGIIMVAGFGIGWESALYTIISIYCMTRVVDTIHTSNQIVTAMIVTTDPDGVIAAITEKMVRGITALASRGGFLGKPNTTLMIVITRYELYDLTQATLGVDKGAFIDILNTVDVAGEFLTSDQQTIKRALGLKPSFNKEQHNAGQLPHE
ncbi:YitT family protein [Lacticaseibacillus mingshuiensis]|uniref:YitT family protein n=1 Tax=Lacticaseibacillus mingshuiensis TaxID=2799574 RepID=UPI0019515B85|nr:YitT family protein [Lacticaseibacillus mingshuiensis]